MRCGWNSKAQVSLRSGLLTSLCNQSPSRGSGRGYRPGPLGPAGVGWCSRSARCLPGPRLTQAGCPPCLRGRPKSSHSPSAVCMVLPSGIGFTWRAAGAPSRPSFHTVLHTQTRRQRKAALGQSLWSVLSGRTSLALADCAHEGCVPSLRPPWAERSSRGWSEAHPPGAAAWPAPALPVSLSVHRTISDWTSSNEKAVTSLLRTLEELKSELSTPGPSQVRAALPPPAWFLSLTPSRGRDLAKCPGAPSGGHRLGCGAQGRCPRAPADPGCSTYRWVESLSQK